ncbi:hypothetical protein [Streptomyces yatensis]|uniref:hypothetical protein n=1 Tax=Streptomyces yatensis TaxID=155177 RepID=UPI001B3C8B7A|nr:hypothetical protein [Streptomyces yatensis]
MRSGAWQGLDLPPAVAAVNTRIGRLTAISPPMRVCPAARGQPAQAVRAQLVEAVWFADTVRPLGAARPVDIGRPFGRRREKGGRMPVHIRAARPGSGAEPQLREGAGRGTARRRRHDPPHTPRAPLPDT